jgi:eukaryotic-like serine/threonine-protein kinase
MEPSDPESGLLQPGVGPSSGLQLAAALRAEQRRRWQAGERVPAEDYLRRHPALSASPEAALDLIYAEFLLREKLGERPTADEFVRRFPAHAEALAAQIELHRAFEPEPDTQTGPARDPLGSTPDLSPDEPTAAPLPEVFGRYRILGQLGRGGMGSVYLAHDTRLDRRVALKVPHFGPNAGGPAVERFYREARTAAAFTHPNLCRVYDVGEWGGLHYLTMPVVEGESLADWLARDAPLPPETAVRLALKVAEAMDVAHRAGVVHRDLKPGNIMVDGRREPIVMDFGLARRAAHDPRLTTSGVFVGTPAYMAPEQYGGDPDAVGPLCDVYALGVMLREMRTDKPPTRQTHLDPRLEAIVRTATAPDPKARYPSMAAFAAALRAYPDAGRRTRRALLLPARPWSSWRSPERWPGCGRGRPRPPRTRCGRGAAGSGGISSSLRSRVFSGPSRWRSRGATVISFGGRIAPTAATMSC